MNTDKLKRLGACSEAVKWVSAQPNKTTAWNTCPCGDWMLWLLGRLSGGPESASRRRLVLAAVECAKLAYPYLLPSQRKAMHRCVRVTTAWARGDRNVSLDDVRQAAASAAASAADASASAAYASASAAYASASASAAASAADAAASAAASAADAYASASATRQRVLAKCADIVRKHYPEPPVL